MNLTADELAHLRRTRRAPGVPCTDLDCDRCVIWRLLELVAQQARTLQPVRAHYGSLIQGPD